MPLATLVDAPEFALGALRVRSLAVPSRGSVELATWRVDLPAGSTSGAHSISNEQVVVVGSGSITALIGDDVLVAGPGDALALPTDTVLELRNDGDGPADAIVISPAGFTATAGGHTFTPRWAL
ncbi:cupin domain-containing protein [Microbacteriaceae bacterium VKM Ac-2854]|nr:cupin domain-containing protein [Microbacteriaceae bacterium VKM Ac-2854]